MEHLPEREEIVDEVAGIRIAHGRVPAWVMLVIVAVVAWGLYYLITFSIGDTGSFSTNPSEIVGLIGL